MSTAPLLSVASDLPHLAQWMGSLLLDLQMGISPAAKLRSHYLPWVRGHQGEMSRICTNPNTSAALHQVARFFAPARTEQDQVRLPRLREAALTVYEYLSGKEGAGAPHLAREEYCGLGTYPRHLPDPWDLHATFQNFPGPLQDVLKKCAQEIPPCRMGEAATVDWSPHLIRAVGISLSATWIATGLSTIQQWSEGHPLQLSDSETVVFTHFASLLDWLQTTPLPYQDEFFTRLAEADQLKGNGRMKTVGTAIDVTNELMGKSLHLHTVQQPNSEGKMKSVYRLSHLTADPTLLKNWRRIIPDQGTRATLITASRFTEEVLLSSRDQFAAGMARALLHLSPVGNPSLSAEQTRTQLTLLRSLLELFLDDHPALSQASFFEIRLPNADMDRTHQAALMSLLSSHTGTRYLQNAVHDYHVRRGEGLPAPKDDPKRDTVATFPQRRQRLLNDLMALEVDILRGSSIPKLKQEFLPRLAWSRCALLEVAIEFTDLRKAVEDLDGRLEVERIGIEELAAITKNITKILEKLHPEETIGPGPIKTAFGLLSPGVQQALRDLVPRVGRRIFRTDTVRTDPTYDEKFFHWLIAEWLAEALVTLHTKPSPTDQDLATQVDEVLDWLSRASQATMFTVVRFILSYPWIASQGKMKAISQVLDGYNRRFEKGYEIKTAQIPTSDETTGKTQLSAVVRKNEPNPGLASHFEGDTVSLALITKAANLSKDSLLSDRRWPDGLVRAIAVLEPQTRKRDAGQQRPALVAIKAIFELFAGPKACLEAKHFFDSRLPRVGVSKETLGNLASQINMTFGTSFVFNNGQLVWNRDVRQKVRRTTPSERKRLRPERLEQKRQAAAERKASLEAAKAQRRQAREQAILQARVEKERLRAEQRQRLKEEQERRRQAAADACKNDFAIGQKVFKKHSGPGKVLGVVTKSLAGHSVEWYQVRFRFGVNELVPKAHAYDWGLRKAQKTTGKKKKS